MKTITIGWLNKCRCGNKSHTVKTVHGNESALWDDDDVKCNSCGREGVIQVCEGQARVLWETNEEMAERKPMTFTKEQLIARINQVTAINKFRISRDPGADGLAMDNELLAIALASLEAEAVAYIDPFTFKNFATFRAGETENKRMGREWVWANPDAGLVPVFTAPPAPVSVPAGYRLQPISEYDAMCSALLQGKAEPVSNRDELPLDYLQGHKDGLEWAAQLAEANHPQTGDWLYDDPIKLAKAIRKGPDMPEACGNSPVIPDGWVMVPVELTPNMREAYHQAQAEYEDTDGLWCPDHQWQAMLAAAPQQEVKP